MRTVQYGGELSFANRIFRVSKAFRGERVAIRPTPMDGVMAIYFMTHRIAQIDLRDAVE